MLVNCFDVGTDWRMYGHTDGCMDKVICRDSFMPRNYMYITYFPLQTLCPPFKYLQFIVILIFGRVSIAGKSASDCRRNQGNVFTNIFLKINSAEQRKREGRN